MKLMKLIPLLTLTLLLSNLFSLETLSSNVAFAATTAQVGQAAPSFSVVDANGKARTLAEFAGKTVVLEWFNYGCPFVQKHYGAGNMQALQKEYTGKGVVWLSVLSSAKGKEGYSTPADAIAQSKKHQSLATAVLLDADGKMGKTYGARTTPHMYIISSKGTLVYAGSIDDKASAEQSDIPGAKNYVRAALDEILAGKAVTQASTKPYGCSVKYAD